MQPSVKSLRTSNTGLYPHPTRGCIPREGNAHLQLFEEGFDARRVRGVLTLRPHHDREPHARICHVPCFRFRIFGLWNWDLGLGVCG